MGFVNMTKNIKKYLYFMVSFLSIIMVFVSTHVLAENNENQWKTHKNKNNIVIRYRQYQNSDLLDINACLKTRGTPHQALEFLTYPKFIKHWLDNLENISLIEQITPSRNIMSSTFSGMFLVKPRQAFVYSKISVSNDGIITINQKDAGSRYKAEKGYIRVNLIRAAWQISPTQDSHIDICYSVVADPQGNIPQWLANRVALGSLTKTLRNVQHQFKPTNNSL